MRQREKRPHLVRICHCFVCAGCVKYLPIWLDDSDCDIPLTRINGVWAVAVHGETDLLCITGGINSAEGVEIAKSL